MTGSSVFAWRILLGLPMLAIIISRARGWPEVRSVAQRLRREPRLLGLSVLCAFIIGIQLWLFVWAPVYGYALDVSMGYFLLPLVMVVIGRVAYGERLTPLQRVALGFALAGVLHELWLVGSLSWVTVLVALGYPPYFMLRRYLRLGSLSTLWFDMVFISPVALIVLLSQPVPVWQEFAHYPRLFVLAPLIALISSLALAAYLSASRALPLGLFGILGYVEPVLLFMVAVVLLQEPVGTAQWFTYVPIWLAVALVAFEGLLNWLHERRRLHGA
jgi:chloramphenicol-sensitive protein RarD